MGQGDVGRELRKRIAAGAVGFEVVVEVALYSEAGFYSSRGRAGTRRGDFITSVEVGPLFGAVMGRYLDTCWQDLGCPDPFLVSEVGAGVGTLFRSVRRGEPTCWSALEYTLVESSPVLAAEHATLPDGSWRSATTLPSNRQHVVVANELLDNLPFGIAERVADGWAPVRPQAGDGFTLAVGDVDPQLDHLSALAPAAATGSRVPVATVAAAWVESVVASADRLLIVDYGASTAELAGRRQGWLRTYRGHERGSDPFDALGERDITHDVPFDQLPEPVSQMSQNDWLGAHGIDELVASAREVWHERAHIGDLAAIAARSAIGESEALTDLTGLGAFQVLEWGLRRKSQGG